MKETIGGIPEDQGSMKSSSFNGSERKWTTYSGLTKTLIASSLSKHTQFGAQSNEALASHVEPLR